MGSLPKDKRRKSLIVTKFIKWFTTTWLLILKNSCNSSQRTFLNNYYSIEIHMEMFRLPKLKPKSSLSNWYLRAWRTFQIIREISLPCPIILAMRADVLSQQTLIATTVIRWVSMLLPSLRQDTLVWWAASGISASNQKNGWQEAIHLWQWWTSNIGKEKMSQS